jgi:hypothetical protein
LEFAIDVKKLKKQKPKGAKLMVKRLLKLHLSLFKYLLTEFCKPKSLKTHIYFVKDIRKNYCKVMLKEYKSLFLVFDSEYQKQKKEYEKYQQAKKDVINALKVLRYAKEKMKKAGISRQRIRRFFLDASRDEEALNKLIDDLVKEVG